jgi:hypothetical protein
MSEPSTSAPAPGWMEQIERVHVACVDALSRACESDKSCFVLEPDHKLRSRLNQLVHSIWWSRFIMFCVVVRRSVACVSECDLFTVIPRVPCPCVHPPHQKGDNLPSPFRSHQLVARLIGQGNGINLGYEHCFDMLEPQVEHITRAINLTFSCIFVIEALFEVMARGLLWTGPQSYLRNNWRLFDCLNAILALLNIITIYDYTFIRVFRLMELIPGPYSRCSHHFFAC